MALQKATLQEISSDEKGTPLSEPVEVQFNPTTLHLSISNQIEGGESRGRQARQFVGSSSTQLSCELVFDTADEGTTEKPRSVREKTAIVERFVLPKAGGDEAPPKLRFHWGELILDGVVQSVSLDFDHFAADGTPLRARVSLALSEQNAKYQFLQAGPGASQKGNAPAPGGLSIGAVGGASLSASIGGSFGASIGASVGASVTSGGQATLALGGETAAEFSARVGLDPGAWRGLDVDLSAGLELPAGQEVGFSLDASAALGLGATPGPGAGAPPSLTAAFGLDAPRSAGSGASGAALALAERTAGFALAAAGGVAAAVESVKALEAAGAADAARRAFGSPELPDVPGNTLAPAQTARPARPEQRRAPLRMTGVPTPAAQAAALPAPPPPAADPRATTFGAGVPLRPRRDTADAAGIEPTADPTVAPWVRLQERDVDAPTGAAGRPSGHRKTCACGCGGAGIGRRGR